MKEKFDPMYVPKGDKPVYEGPPKQPVPGGRVVVGAKAYCDAWRRYAEPIAAFTGWHIHSFGKEIKFVSPDYKHTQTMSIAFVEALFEAIKKEYQCQNKPIPRPVYSSNAPSSSGGSPILPRFLVSRPSSSGPATWTFDTKEDSSEPATSSSRSRTSSK